MKTNSMNRTKTLDQAQFVMIVPCFNEEKRFNNVYFNDLIDVEGTVWIFVDDGSNDNTLSILKSFCKSKKSDYLQLSHNVGKSEAIRMGFIHAVQKFPEAIWYGFIDSDGAFDSNDVKRIIERAKNGNFESYLAVFSSRIKLSGRNIQRKNYRHIIGRIVATMFGVIWRDIPYDTQSGFKILRNSENLTRSILEPFKTRWFFDIELIVRLAERTQQPPIIWEEPLQNWIDIEGSKISIREVVRLFNELFKVNLILFEKRKYINVRKTKTL